MGGLGNGSVSVRQRGSLVSRACDQCRASKRKCDAGHPCSKCSSQGKACTYLRVPFKRGRKSLPSVFSGSNMSTKEMLSMQLPAAGPPSASAGVQRAQPSASPSRITVPTYFINPGDKNDIQHRLDPNGRGVVVGQNEGELSMMDGRASDSDSMSETLSISAVDSHGNTQSSMSSVEKVCWDPTRQSHESRAMLPRKACPRADAAAGGLSVAESSILGPDGVLHEESSAVVDVGEGKAMMTCVCPCGLTAMLNPSLLTASNCYCSLPWEKFLTSTSVMDSNNLPATSPCPSNPNTSLDHDDIKEFAQACQNCREQMSEGWVAPILAQSGKLMHAVPSLSRAMIPPIESLRFTLMPKRSLLAAFRLDHLAPQSAPFQGCKLISATQGLVDWLNLSVDKLEAFDRCEGSKAFPLPVSAMSQEPIFSKHSPSIRRIQGMLQCCRRQENGNAEGAKCLVDVYRCCEGRPALVTMMYADIIDLSHSKCANAILNTDESVIGCSPKIKCEEAIANESLDRADAAVQSGISKFSFDGSSAVNTHDMLPPLATDAKDDDVDHSSEMIPAPLVYEDAMAFVESVPSFGTMPALFEGQYAPASSMAGWAIEGPDFEQTIPDLDMFAQGGDADGHAQGSETGWTSDAPSSLQLTHNELADMADLWATEQ